MTDKLLIKREERYTVIKHKDLTVDDRAELDQFIQSRHIPTRECLVIESDWPEYEPAWRMIEDRVTGAAPRQPEGEGLEVVGLQWLDSGHYRKKPPKYGFNPHDWNELCRLSDAQRAIAELRAEIAKWEKCHKEVHSPALNDAHAMIAELREECEHLKACQENAMLHMTGLVAERDTLRQQLAERDADGERWRYTQHPDYFCCGPYDTDGDYCGYSVGVLKHANGKQLSLSHCIEGRGDSLEEAIDTALAEVNK